MSKYTLVNKKPEKGFFRAFFHFVVFDIAGAEKCRMQVPPRLVAYIGNSSAFALANYLIPGQSQPPARSLRSGCCFLYIIYNVSYRIFAPTLRLCSRLQHILDENTISSLRVIHKHKRYVNTGTTKKLCILGEIQSFLSILISVPVPS